MAVGLLILRVVVGALFFGHGAQKLFGWFGGHGIDGTAGFMDSLGCKNSRVAAMLAGLTETISGLLLAVGLLTPLAAAGIIGVMVNAIATVHWRKGLWNANGGMELPLVYAVAAAALGFAGAGAYSLDRVFHLHLAGAAYGVSSIALGSVAGLIALTLLRRQDEKGPDALSRGDPEIRPEVVRVRSWRVFA